MAVSSVGTEQTKANNGMDAWGRPPLAAVLEERFLTTTTPREEDFFAACSPLARMPVALATPSLEKLYIFAPRRRRGGPPCSLHSCSFAPWLQPGLNANVIHVSVQPRPLPPSERDELF
uniref:Uncharacterized protein n=1 Tax=Panagrellus redivivus TaxID=6233 RepID=A0A7E4VUZ3_PANRE